MGFPWFRRAKPVAPQPAAPQPRVPLPAEVRAAIEDASFSVREPTLDDDGNAYPRVICVGPPPLGVFMVPSERATLVARMAARFPEHPPQVHEQVADAITRLAAHAVRTRSTPSEIERGAPPQRRRRTWGGGWNPTDLSEPFY